MMEGSGRPKTFRIRIHSTDFWESKWHVSHLVRLSQPFTALKIIKKVEQSVLEEAILSLDMPTIDQLLGQRVYCHYFLSLWSQCQVLFLTRG
jgi:hypothetical protein